MGWNHQRVSSYHSTNNTYLLFFHVEHTHLKVTWGLTFSSPIFFIWGLTFPIFVSFQSESFLVGIFNFPPKSDAPWLPRWKKRGACCCKAARTARRRSVWSWKLRPRRWLRKVRGWARPLGRCQKSGPKKPVISRVNKNSTSRGEKNPLTPFIFGLL